MDGTLHILLVRHGQTEANQNGVVQGHQPTSLNSVGLRQAELVAERLAGFQPGIDVLISSDLPRARQTAAPIAHALGLGVCYDPVWRERCYGAFEGMGHEERAAARQRLNLGPHDLPPGAQPESNYQFDIRAALLRLVDQHATARCIAVVTHGGACRAVAMMLADGRLPAAPGNPVPGDFACPNAAVTHLIHRVTDAGPEYRYGCIYDVTHLEPAAVTALDAG